jgi:hypothetical protein
MTNTPIFYSHKELYEPAKPVKQEPVQTKPENPYQYALYNCGEALL